MMLKKAVAAGLLLASLASTADARRRAVGTPAQPLNPVSIVQPVTAVLPVSGSGAQAHISMTNHADETKLATLCDVIAQTPGKAAGCKAYTIAPGETVAVDVAAEFRQEPGMMAISADMDRLEVRNHLPAQPLESLLGPGLPTHLLGPANAFGEQATATLYTAAETRVKLTLRSRYGSMISERTETLPAYSIKSYSYFGNTPKQDDTALEITVEKGRAGALLHTWGETQTVTPASRARTESWLPASAATVKNNNVTATNGVIWEHLKTDTDNTHPDAKLTTYLNAETMTEEPFTGGAMHVRGTSPLTIQARAGNLRLPVFNADDGATAQAGDPKRRPDVDLSINGLAGGSVDLISLSPGPVTAYVTSYAGDREIGRQTKVIPRASHARLDIPGAERVLIDLADNANPANVYVPRVLAYATTTINGETVAKEGYPITRAHKVTGEDVAKMFFDPWVRAGSYYLNNDITRCMLLGNCGFPSVKSELAEIYTRGIGENWTKQQFENWLSTMSDGITTYANIELWQNAKPRGMSHGGVSYALSTSQTVFTNEPGAIQLIPTDRNAHITIDRQSVVNYFNANPEKGCGTKETGPSLDAKCPAYSFGNQLTYP